MFMKLEPMELGSNDEDFKMIGKGYKLYTNCQKEDLDKIIKNLEIRGIKYIISENAYTDTGCKLQDKNYRAVYVKR